MQRIMLTGYVNECMGSFGTKTKIYAFKMRAKGDRHIPRILRCIGSVKQEYTIYIPERILRRAGMSPDSITKESLYIQGCPSINPMPMDDVSELGISVLCTCLKYVSKEKKSHIDSLICCVKRLIQCYIELLF